MNIAALLRESTARTPSKTALVFAPDAKGGSRDAKAADETKLTFEEFDRKVDRVAAGLARLGIEPGDRVAIAMHNVPAFPISYFGILRAGAVVVPLNVMLTEAEAARVLKDSETRIVLGTPPFVDVVRAAAEGTSVEKVISTDAWDELTKSAKDRVEVDRSDDDLAVLAYTSGTTGDPKGAILSHGNLRANLRQQMSIPEAHVEGKDVLFLALPLFHIFGLNVTLGLLALTGATGVLVERFDPIPSLRLIRDHHITVLFGAPTMYSSWVGVPGGDQYDLPAFGSRFRERPRFPPTCSETSGTSLAS